MVSLKIAAIATATLVLTLPALAQISLPNEIFGLRYVICQYSGIDLGTYVHSSGVGIASHRNVKLRY
jgi:hypothetical protein